MLTDEQIKQIVEPLAKFEIDGAVLSHFRAVAEAAAQAERHRIYAALEADPGALWRDQGFQEWRRNREVS